MNSIKKCSEAINNIKNKLKVKISRKIQLISNAPYIYFSLCYHIRYVISLMLSLLAL